MNKKIKVISFDADDTLWVNELYYKETEKKFAALLKEYLPEDQISEELFNVEIQNMDLYGYGAKAFILSLIETSLKITNLKVDPLLIENIIKLGKELLIKPIVLLDGVKKVLDDLYPDYKLIIATKGDLLDQERKLHKSNLSKYFHHIEVMSDKKTKQYMSLLKHLDIEPDEFVMIGNSLKSDILPVLEIGSYAIHVPYHTTWQYEQVDVQINSDKFYEVEKIEKIVGIFK